MRKSNREIFIEQFEKHKGQMVITNSNDVQRLIAIGTDQYDYYYVCYDGNQVTWFSHVGSYVPLKGKIDDKHYDRITYIAKINHPDQPECQLYAKEDLDKVNKRAIERLNTAGESHEFITEVCLDIN